MACTTLESMLTYNNAEEVQGWAGSAGTIDALGLVLLTTKGSDKLEFHDICALKLMHWITDGHAGNMTRAGNIDAIKVVVSVMQAVGENRGDTHERCASEQEHACKRHCIS